MIFPLIVALLTPLLALTPPKSGVYEAFTEFDDHLSMYLTIYPDRFKVQLTFKQEVGFFAIALPVNDQQFRMRDADAFIYGALDGFEKSEDAELREFYLSNHMLEADRRVHHSKIKVTETKKEDGHIVVTFERPNEVGTNDVGGAGVSMSEFNTDLPMLWAHSSVGGFNYLGIENKVDAVIRDHGAGNRGAVIFSLDGAHSVTYASPGVIAHTIISFIAMGILVPLGSLWDRLRFGNCRKFSIMAAAAILLAGVVVGYFATDDHLSNSHATLSLILCGLFVVYLTVQMLRGDIDKETFSAVRMGFSVTLTYGMFVLTYFVFTSGVNYLAVSPLVGRGINVLLALYFAVLSVAVCGPLIHYLRMRSKRYQTVGTGEGPATAGDDAL